MDENILWQARCVQMMDRVMENSCCQKLNTDECYSSKLKKSREFCMERISFDSKEEWLKLRSQDITSTEVSALFGLNPWFTEFELYHQKINEEIIEIEDNERMKWGRRLEDAIAAGFAEENEWTVKPFKDYARLPDKRTGSSFDYEVCLGENESELLEIKNVDSLIYRDKWTIEEGKVIEAPPHIELQLQHQLGVTSWKRGHIGALVGGNNANLLTRNRDEEIIGAINEKVAAFWKRVADRNPPEPDFEQDAKFISRLYDYAEPGKSVSCEGNDQMTELALIYDHHGKIAREAEKKKQAAKAQMLTLIGNSEKVRGDGFSISAGVVGPKEISYTREGYRNFRVYIKKQK